MAMKKEPESRQDIKNTSPQEENRAAATGIKQAAVPPKQPVNTQRAAAPAVKKPIAPAAGQKPAAARPPATPVMKPAPQAKAPVAGDGKKKDAAEQSQEDIKKMPLGKRLMIKGLISKDQLETALKEQSRQGDKKQMLGKILVNMGFITESALAEVLTEASGVKAFDFKHAVLDSNLIKKVPREVAQRCKGVPVSIEGKEISVALTDIYNIVALDQMKRYFPPDVRLVPVYATEQQILEILEQYHGYETSIEGILREIEESIAGKEKLSGEAESYTNPTVRLVDAILVDAIKKGVSDIHLEPEGNFLRIRYRLDGKLMQFLSFHKEYWSAVVVRIKIMSDMNIAETRLPQDGRTSYQVLGRDVDFRVATHPTVHGENVVLRILDKQKSLVEMEHLGLSDHNLELLDKLLKKPEGVIVVTGPTGSGKTTTLYSVLSYINSVEINIMTLENPVEYQLPMIRQADIKEDSGMDFSSGIKSLMRQDPDVVFVGEVRDEETASNAMRAAMTGHKVFTTLHTNDAQGVLTRLVDIGVPPHILADALTCAIAQRLMRRLCNQCKEPYKATAEDRKILGLKEEGEVTLYRSKGCDACMGLGYKGRIAVHEIFYVDEVMKELIQTHATRAAMIEQASKVGFICMADDGAQKVIQGHSDVKELMRVVDVVDRL